MSSRNKGVSLVEALVGSAIIVVIVAAVSSAYSLYLSQHRVSTDRVKVALLLEEGMEAIRSMRDSGWGSSFGVWLTDSTYYLYFDETQSRWEATTTPQIVDGRFERWFIVNEVYRDSNDDISSSGSIDQDTKKVSMNAIWFDPADTGIFFDEGVTDDDLANFPSNDAGDGNPAQSFTSGKESVEVVEVKLPLKRLPGTTPSDIYLEIRETSTVGSILGVSETVEAVDLTDDTLTWTSFYFPTPPTLSPDTQYYLRLRSNPPSTEEFSGSEGTVNWGYKQSAEDPYSGGNAYRYVGRLSDENDSGQELLDYDFSFRLFEKGSTTGSSTVAGYFTNLFK